MQGSKLYGVELDSITGRIAQQLYPEMCIRDSARTHGNAYAEADRRT